jgi:hypothetical protein
MFLLRSNKWALKTCLLFPVTVYCFCSMKNDVLLKIKLKNIIFRPCRTNNRIRSSRLIASGETALVMILVLEPYCDSLTSSCAYNMEI